MPSEASGNSSQRKEKRRRSSHVPRRRVRKSNLLGEERGAGGEITGRGVGVGGGARVLV